MSVEDTSGTTDTSRPAAKHGHSPALSPARLVAGVCLAVPFVVLLWVPSYNRITPALGGMPFFYWYQLAWILITVVLTVVAYLLVSRDARPTQSPTAGTNPTEARP